MLFTENAANSSLQAIRTAQATAGVGQEPAKHPNTGTAPMPPGVAVQSQSPPRPGATAA